MTQGWSKECKNHASLHWVKQGCLKNFAPLDGEGDFHIEDLCGDLSKVSAIQVRCSLQRLSSEHSTQRIGISGESGKVFGVL